MDPKKLQITNKHVRMAGFWDFYKHGQTNGWETSMGKMWLRDKHVRTVEILNLILRTILLTRASNRGSIIRDFFLSLNKSIGSILLFLIL